MKPRDVSAVGVEDKTLLFAVHRGGALRRGVEQGWLGSGGFFSVSCGSVSWVMGEFVSQFGVFQTPFHCQNSPPLFFPKSEKA